MIRASTPAALAAALCRDEAIEGLPDLELVEYGEGTDCHSWRVVLDGVVLGRIDPPHVAESHITWLAETRHGAGFAEVKTLEDAVTSILSHSGEALDNARHDARAGW